MAGTMTHFKFMADLDKKLDYKGNKKLFYVAGQGHDLLFFVKLKDLKPFKHFMPTVALFIPQAAIQVYVQLNKTMLGIFVGTTASGFYQYSDNLVKMIMTIVTATGTVMLPHVSNAFAKGDHKKVNELLNNSFDFVSFIAIPMAFGLSFAIAILMFTVVLMIQEWKERKGAQE